MKYFFVVFLILMTSGLPATAAEKNNSRPKTIWQFSYTPVVQFDTQFKRGGEFNVNRHLFRLNITRFLSPKWMIGTGLSLDYEDWHFSEIEGMAGIEFWNEIIRPGISIPVLYNMNDRFRFAFIPSCDVAGATGAEFDESVSYGIVLSAACVVDSDLTIGLGGGFFNRLDQFKCFPYVVINWQINDRLELKNPFNAGPVGPAGIELIYHPKRFKYMEMSVGGAYRDYRFRLDDSSTVSDGIGQVSFYASFVRLGFPLSRKIFVDIHSGAFYSGEMVIDDKHAHEIGNADVDTAPFLSMTIKGRF